MKAILEFSLPEESAEHRNAINAYKYYSILLDIDNSLRSHLKHGSQLKTADEMAEHIRGLITEEINLYEV